MRSGLDWRRLEKDWRWTDCGLEVDFVDEMGTGGGLHEDPWGSVRYSNVKAKIQDKEVRLRTMSSPKFRTRMHT